MQDDDGAAPTREAQEIFGAAVRLARMRSGLTQEHLAQRTGLDVKTVSRIENGLKDTMLSTAVRIAGIFGSDFADMSRREEPQSLPEARRVVFAALDRYYRIGTANRSWVYAEPLDLKAVLTKIRFAVSNRAMLAWLDAGLVRIGDGDCCDAHLAFVRSASESGDVLGGLVAAELREAIGSIDPATLSRGLAGYRDSYIEDKIRGAYVGDWPSRAELDEMHYDEIHARLAAEVARVRLSSDEASVQCVSESLPMARKRFAWDLQITFFSAIAFSETHDRDRLESCASGSHRVR